jgi:plastocyanin
MKIDFALLASGLLGLAFVGGLGAVGGQLGCSSDTPAPATDAGTTDTGAAVTDSGGGDTGTTPAALNGCAAADYVDRSAAGADRTVTWGFDQKPKCMKIAKGQTVTFNGDFTQHPLVEKGGDTPNPFASPKGSGGTRTVDFAAAGNFGYVCAIHGSITGAIFVQ